MAKTTSEFWTELGMTAPSGPLEEPIRFRIERDLRQEIDRIEAFARGAGYRDVTRSDIIRVALQSFVEGFRNSVPEVGEISLPEERPLNHRARAGTGTTRSA